MSRFFFNIYDGVRDIDHDGKELKDWHAARQHAIKLAAQVLDDEAHRIEMGELWYMDVTDEGGLSLFRLDFHVTMSPALHHAKAKAGTLP